MFGWYRGLVLKGDYAYDDFKILRNSKPEPADRKKRSFPGDVAGRFQNPESSLTVYVSEFSESEPFPLSFSLFELNAPRRNDASVLTPFVCQLQPSNDVVAIEKR